MSLVFCTDWNDTYVHYGLNRGKKCVVCVFSTALQRHPGEEEKTGMEMKDPKCRPVQLWVQTPLLTEKEKGSKPSEK